MVEMKSSAGTVVKRSDFASGGAQVTSAIMQSPKISNSHDTIEITDNQLKQTNSSKVITSLISGAAAGAVAKTTIAPLDRTKINFQITNKHFSVKEVIDFVTKSYRMNGLLSLWRGNSATMARIIPYAAIQYTAHEQWKHILNVETHEQRKANPGKSFIAGSLAGVVSSTFTYPLDLARARMAVTHKEM